MTIEGIVEFLNNTVFGLLESVFSFVLCMCLLKKRYSKRISIGIVIFGILILWGLMHLLNPLPVIVRALIILAVTTLLHMILFRERILVIVFFRSLFDNELVIIDLVLGNVISFIFRTDLNTIFANKYYMFFFGIGAKLLLALLIFISFRFFKRLDFGIDTKYWFVIDSIVLSFYAITVNFMQIIPGLDNPEYQITMTISGTIFLIINFAVVFLFGALCRFFQGQKQNYIMLMTNQALEHQLSLQEKTNADIRKIKHDMDNHMMAVSALLSEEKLEETKRYVDGMIEKLQQATPGVKTGNSTLDAVMNLKLNLAESKQIKCLHRFEGGCSSELSSVELSVIVNNLMDNAIEAAVQLKPDDRYIKIKLIHYKAFYIISIENPFCGTVEIQDGLAETTKKDRSIHGYGLKSAKASVEKLGGELILEANQGVFCATVMLNNSSSMEMITKT